MNDFALAVAGVSAALTAILYVWTAWSLSALFAKAGQARWQAWVPVLNLIVLLRLGGISAWFVLVALVPGLGQIALLVVWIMAAHRIGRAFGFGTGMTVLAALVPPVWSSVLGWGSARWLGEPAQDEPGPLRVGRTAPAGPAPTPRPEAATQPDAAGSEAAPSAVIPVALAAPARIPPAPIPPAPIPPVRVPTAPIPRASMPPAPAAVPVPPAPGVPLAAAPRAGAGAPPADASASPAPISSVPGVAAAAPSAPSWAPPTAPTAPAPALAAPAAPFAASPRPGHAERAPDDAAEPEPEFDLDGGLEVSAIAGAPTLGEPRSARSAVSAQHSFDEIPDEDVFDVTVMAARRRSTWSLVPPLGEAVLVTADVVIIGRRPGFDADFASAQLVPVADETRTVSKTHARLERRGEEWVVIDLNSTNGVILIDDGGDEIDATPGVPERLTERFLLGDAPLRMRREGP
ncbi:MAG: DUF5684 domain-containing protein [Microbacteriaceae bacterium]